MKKQLSFFRNQATVGNNSDSIADNDAAITTNQGNIVNFSSNIDALNVSLFWFLIKETIVSKQSKQFQTFKLYEKLRSFFPNTQATVGNVSDDIANNNAAMINVSSKIDNLEVSLPWI